MNELKCYTAIGVGNESGLQIHLAVKLKLQTLDPFPLPDVWGFLSMDDGLNPSSSD